MPAIAALLAAQVLTAAAPAGPPPLQVRTPDIVADFYRPAQPGRAPAILLLGGSEGGLGAGVAKEAAVLAAHGYAVLQVCYFGCPGQAEPQQLKLVSLETFSRALDWLLARPDVDPAHVGVVGTSKGAEAALLIAARRRELKIAVVGVPSSVAWAGIDGANMVVESSWSEHGKPVPFMPYGWTGSWKGIRALYEDGLAQNGAARADAVIPVERINGPVFMVCGQADTLWPSCPMASAIQQRLTAKAFSHPVTLLAYADAGHAAFGPPVSSANPNYPKLAGLGGTLEANAAAREASWPKALAALDAALGPVGR